MLISEIILSGFYIKSSIPNNFTVVSINYISNTVGLRSSTIDQAAIMNSADSTVLLSQEAQISLPIIDQSKTS
jgi:hypothetical protein